MNKKGKRYEGEPKLNLKKVFAVLIAILVIIMIGYIIKSLLSQDKETGRISSTSYFALYAENKWGVIDNFGKEIIVPTYKEMIIVPNNKKDVFLCTYDINDTTGEYKTKVLNSKNDEIFTQYNKVEALDNYDSTNNAWYEENVLKVEKDGKYGLIDLSGKELAPCQYDNIQGLQGVKNSLLLKQNETFGLVNAEGKTIVEVKYKEIKKLGNDYKDGYIVKDENNKWGLIDYTGKQILENKYEEIDQIFGKNYYVIKEGQKQKVINASGEVKLENGYDEIAQILTHSEDGVIYKKDNKYGMMNFSGETKIENTYEELKEVKSSTFIAKKDGKYGVIDISSNIKIEFIYTNIKYNSQADIYIATNEKYENPIIDNEFNIKLTGILSEINTDKGYMKLKIGDEYKYYNFKFEEKTSKDILTSNTLFLSKKDGKYGFINNKDEVVVDYQYDDATEQNPYGYSAIKKDGKWGCIDINGKIVVEPKYNLDNNYLIDFIGKWHLGQDVNMNYYCEK